MRAPEFNEAQITAALRQLEAGIPADEICESFGVSPATLSTWQSRYGGLCVAELSELIRLEREVASLSALVGRLIVGTRLAILMVAIFGVWTALQS